MLPPPRAQGPEDNFRVGLTYWFTGFSGAGKSTLAQALAQYLRSQGQAVCVLDGDELRTELCKDLGYSSADRTENMRRTAAVAQLLNRQGITAIAALISPIAAGRAAARQVIGAEQFMEVHVSTPLTVCQQRDPKGLYARAQNEPALLLTGIDALYEPPLAPDLCIDTSQLSLPQAVARIASFRRG